MLAFTSVRKTPQLILPSLDSIAEHWKPCYPWYKKFVNIVLETPGPLPDLIVASKGKDVIGCYTLDLKPIEGMPSLWIPTLYIAPAFRRNHYSPVIIQHAKKMGKELGFDKMYLVSEHTNLYEKFGFELFGPDLCALGDPTQMFVGKTA